MDLHQLYVFTKVVEHKSFSKAAEAIFLSQSTVSSHIQSLEKGLNVQLFDRVGRDIILTPYGERLYYWAMQLLHLKDEALLDIKRSVSDLHGMIHMAVSSVPGQFLVPKFIHQFRKEFHQVHFTIYEHPSKVVAEKVMSGTVDLGFLGEKYVNERLHYIPLTKEKLVVIAPKKLNLEHTISLFHLKEYPIVMRKNDSGTKSILDKFFKKQSIKEEQLNIVAYTESNQTLIELVKEGVGIAIISEIAAQNLKNNEITIHDLNEFDDERYFYLVYNENKTLSLVAKLFINEVKNHFQKGPFQSV